MFADTGLTAAARPDASVARKSSRVSGRVDFRHELSPA
jgi:hypothetical protein